MQPLGLLGSLVLSLSLLPLWTAPAVAGAEIIVTTTDLVSATDCTLPDAMFAANFDLEWNQCPAGDGADVITITATGTITLIDALANITTPLEIHGPGAGALTIRRSETEEAFAILTVTADGNATVTGLALENGLINLVGLGGAGVANFGTLVLEDAVVAGNVTDISSDSVNPAPRGGGILNNGTMTIRRSTISGNVLASAQTADSGETSAFAGGGGIFNNDSGVLTVERSLITGNSASAEVASTDPPTNAAARGGGIENFGTATITSSTISGNTTSAVSTPPVPASTQGGGIFNAATLTLASSTVAANTASVAANLGADGTETVTGTILADGIGGADCFGAVTTDGGFNLEFPAGCTGLGAALHADPLLGPLADNGGPTMTHAIPKASPAVDGATAPDVDGDQRGMPRPYDQPGVANADDGTDIGAFELQDVTPPQTTITKKPRKRIETTARRVRVVFKFRSSEPGSDFLCRRDRGPWKACDSPLAYRVGQGSHVFRAKAIDAAGNPDPTAAAHRFRVIRV